MMLTILACRRCRLQGTGICSIPRLLNRRVNSQSCAFGIAPAYLAADFSRETKGRDCISTDPFFQCFRKRHNANSFDFTAPKRFFFVNGTPDADVRDPAKSNQNLTGFASPVDDDFTDPVAPDFGNHIRQPARISFQPIVGQLTSLRLERILKSLPFPFEIVRMNFKASDMCLEILRMCPNISGMDFVAFHIRLEVSRMRLEVSRMCLKVSHMCLEVLHMCLKVSDVCRLSAQFRDQRVHEFQAETLETSYDLFIARKQHGSALKMSERPELISRVVVQEAEFVMRRRIFFIEPQQTFKMTDGLPPILRPASGCGEGHAIAGFVRLKRPDFRPHQVIFSVGTCLTDCLDNSPQPLFILWLERQNGTFSGIEIDVDQFGSVDLGVEKFQRQSSQGDSILVPVFLDLQYEVVDRVVPAVPPPGEVAGHQFRQIFRSDHSVAAEIIENDGNAAAHHCFDCAAPQRKHNIGIVDMKRQFRRRNCAETSAQESDRDAKSGASFTDDAFPPFINAGANHNGIPRRGRDIRSWAEAVRIHDIPERAYAILGDALPNQRPPDFLTNCQEPSDLQIDGGRLLKVRKNAVRQVYHRQVRKTVTYFHGGNVVMHMRQVKVVIPD